MQALSAADVTTGEYTVPRNEAVYAVGKLRVLRLPVLKVGPAHPLELPTPSLLPSAYAPASP